MLNGFHLVRDMQECTFLFHRKKANNNNKNVRKTWYWKLIFVISREHVGTQSTRGTWARKHARHVGTWARKHARHVGTWARKARNLADSIIHCYFRLPIRNSLYTLSYLHCYFRLYTKELFIYLRFIYLSYWKAEYLCKK